MGATSFISSRRTHRMFVCAALVAATLIPRAPSAAPAGNAFADWAERTGEILPVDTVTARRSEAGARPVADSFSTMRTPSYFIGKAFSFAGSERNPATYTRAARAMLEATWGQRVQSMSSMTSRRAQPDLVVEPGPVVDRFAVPAGDLTGDDRDDLLLYELEYDEFSYDIRRFDVSARSGADAAVLWTRDLTDVQDAFVLRPGDLDGDGADDVLLLRFIVDDASYPGGCLVLVCAVAERLVYRWEIDALSGPGGVVLWSKTFRGQVTDAFAFATQILAYEYAYAFRATNGLAIPVPVGDVTGDDGIDIAINAFDFLGGFGGAGAYGFVAAAFADASVFFVATNATVARGTNGDTVFSRTQRLSPGGSMLWSAGNAVGDATPDLLWTRAQDVETPVACVFALLGTCAQFTRFSLKIEVLDGADFSPAWEMTRTSRGVQEIAVTPFGRDLTGDGHDDLAVTEFEAYYVATGYGVMSGADGELVWMADADYDDVGLAVIGPVGGGAGADLLAFRLTYDIESFGFTLRRLDGATGEELLATQHVNNGYYGYIDAYLVGDADGDGTEDVGILTADYNEEGLVDAVAVIESGRTGSVLYQRSGADFAVLFSAGDVNADGRADLYAALFEVTRNSVSLTLSAIAMPQGRTLWSRTDALFYWSLVNIEVTGDQSGRGGDDALYNRSQYADRPESRVDGLDGRRGSLLWGYGDALTLPPPAPTAMISGTVTDALGAPVVAACVDVYTVDGDWAGSAQTDAAGAYSVAELATGSYKVLFEDCVSFLLASEWYDGKSNFADADPVDVTDGKDTRGINATLVTRGDPSEDPVVRTESRSYIGAGGDAVASDPVGACEPESEGEETASIGGACFDLDGNERQVSLSITDDNASKAVAGSWKVVDELGDTLGYGPFCGDSGVIELPSYGTRLWVFTSTARSAVNCEEVEAAITGTVTTVFS